MWDISWHNSWLIPFGECLTCLKKICRSKSQSSWCYTSSFANKTDNLKSNKILNHRFLLRCSVRPLRKRTNFKVYGCNRGIIGGAKGSSCSGARKKITHAGEKKKKKIFLKNVLSVCLLLGLVKDGCHKNYTDGKEEHYRSGSRTASLEYIRHLKTSASWTINKTLTS